MFSKIFIAACITGVFLSSCGQTAKLVSTNSKTEERPAPDFQLTVWKSNDPAKFNLSIDNPNSQRLQLSIRHKVLGMVVDTVIASSRFASSYNLGLAQDGKYQVMLWQGKFKIVKELELSTIESRQLVIQ